MRPKRPSWTGQRSLYSPVLAVSLLTFTLERSSSHLWQQYQTCDTETSRVVKPKVKTTCSFTYLPRCQKVKLDSSNTSMTEEQSNCCPLIGTSRQENARGCRQSNERGDGVTRVNNVGWPSSTRTGHSDSGIEGEGSTVQVQRVSNFFFPFIISAARLEPSFWSKRVKNKLYAFAWSWLYTLHNECVFWWVT
jgi:hypothetical protein